MSKMQHTMS